MGTTINLNVYNFKRWLGKPALHFDSVRCDSNNNCNIHCVYCGNPRSDELIALGEFRTFLNESVASVGLFQFGCQMEPTLDSRLCDFMTAVAHSPGKPKKMFRLQTNGILLHRHDYGKMREAGLSILTVSMDSSDRETFKKLRGGTSLNKVYRNVHEFHSACPGISIAFVTTVTSANIDSVEDLIESGLEAGVGTFNFRQVIHIPDNSVVDHSQMRNLVVSDVAFVQMKERVVARYGSTAKLHFLDVSTMRQARAAVRADSLLPDLKAQVMAPQ